MNAIRFAQANKDFGPPQGATEGDCNTVHAYVGPCQVSESGSEFFKNDLITITCWRPTPEEQCILAQGGVVWLMIYANGGMVPVSVTAISPFE